MSALIGHLGLMMKAAGEGPSGQAFRAFRLRVTSWVNGNQFPGNGLVRVSNFRILTEGGMFPQQDMKGPSSPAPLVATASSTLSENFPWKAFDAGRSNASRWISAENNSSPQWLEIDLGAGNAIVPTAFLIAADENVELPSSNFIIALTIEGTNTPGVYDSNSRLLAEYVGLPSSRWLPATSDRYFGSNRNESSVAIDPYFNNVVLLMDMEQSAPFLDKSNAAHAVSKFAGAMVQNTGAPWGNSFAHDGSSGSRLEVYGSDLAMPSETEFTIDLVMTLQSFVDGLRMVSWDIFPGDPPHFDTTSIGEVRFRHAGNYFSFGVVQLNVTNHYAVSLDMSTSSKVLRGFLNGVEKFNSTLVGVQAGWAAQEINIGAYGGNPAIPGTIQTFRLTRGVCRYRSDFTPPSKEFPTAGSP